MLPLPLEVPADDIPELVPVSEPVVVVAAPEVVLPLGSVVDVCANAGEAARADATSAVARRYFMKVLPEVLFE
jgi:hypothetical protein